MADRTRALPKRVTRLERLAGIRRAGDDRANAVKAAGDEARKLPAGTPGVRRKKAGPRQRRAGEP